jgi:hypothetical protein
MEMVLAECIFPDIEGQLSAYKSFVSCGIQEYVSNGWFVSRDIEGLILIRMQ